MNTPVLTALVFYVVSKLRCSSSRDVFLNTWPLSLWLSRHVDTYTYFKGFAMHAIIIFLYYLSKLLNLTLNLESLSSRFLNKLILLANISAAGKLFQLVITLLLNVDFPILEWNCFTNILPSEFLVLSVLAASKKWSQCKSIYAHEIFCTLQSSLLSYVYLSESANVSNLIYLYKTCVYIHAIN